MQYEITNDCRACGKCVPACPVEAIKEGEIYRIDPEECIGCGSCVSFCPAGAIVVK